MYSPYPKPTKEKLRAKPDPLPYPKRKPRFAHLGKNLELVIDKALHEENPEKKQAFANVIAYYMKLVYSNWHKENVHDDAIQAELSAITENQLSFTNTPFVRSARTDNRQDRSGYGDYRQKSGRQKFQARSNRNDRNDRNDRNNGNKYKQKRYK